MAKRPTPVEAATILALGKILGVLVQLRDRADADDVTDGIVAASAAVFEIREAVARERQEVRREKRFFRTALGWYFWDETESFTLGPFVDEEQARAACVVYAKNR